MRLFLLIISCCLCLTLTAQQNSDIIKKLGYSPDQKLLIVHADDLGVAHSVNVASIEAYENGGISSASIMVPCPWFPHIAQYASSHPELCWGIHLTLTAEWDHYKWDGVSSSDKISSILDDKNFMYSTVSSVLENYTLEEIENELIAQIERAIDFGIELSHLDSHMGTLFSNEELFEVYLGLGNKYELPVLIPINRMPVDWKVSELLGPFQVPVSQLFMLPQTPDSWENVYDSFLEQVKPGINELIVHLGKDNPELKEVMIDHLDFGATWRQKDLNYLLCDHFKEKLEKLNIQLISWKEIKEKLKK